MPVESAKDVAINEFAKGFNCAEAVLLGLMQEFDLDCSCAPRIATAFGAGMGRHGEVCGALSGAQIALGLKYGREDPAQKETRDKLYEKVRSLLREFKKEFGSVRCFYLLKCDLTTPEGQERSMREGYHINVCPKFVAFAAEKAAELMRES